MTDKEVHQGLIEVLALSRHMLTEEQLTAMVYAIASYEE